MSWMGRAIYGFKDNRYMVTASLRYDGSSRLADGHKWVAFPSVAVAWRISDESFIKDNISNISNLKLRLVMVRLVTLLLILMKQLENQ